MPFYLFHWNELIERHLDEHGITPDEFEWVVCNPVSVETSRTSKRLVAFGEAEGKLLACVYEMIDETTILPVTAFEVE